MNREILFRGKRVDNGEWVYGYLRAFDDGSYHITTKVERNVARHIDGKPFYTLYGVEHEVYPKTVGQYTGLKDKNGVEIYEGDIVRPLSEGYGDVYFDEGQFWINWSEGLQPLVDCYRELTVVGNIHDNPELLEVLGDEPSNGCRLI